MDDVFAPWQVLAENPLVRGMSVIKDRVEAVLGQSMTC